LRHVNKRLIHSKKTLQTWYNTHKYEQTL
jgi:hypothetical protein